ncbi:serine hydrolase domain-containing protein [Rhizobium sp. A37_96]
MLNLLQDWLDATGAPGVSVAIDDGQTIRCFCAGTADMRTGAAVVEETAFQLGSVSKSITAFLLVEALSDKGMTLDTPVVDIAPDLRASNEYAFHDTTVGHLLSHTSGLDSQWWVDMGQGAGARRAAARAIVSLPLIAPPGELFSYSNSGYVLAGYLTESLSGQRWEEFAEDRIARFLGSHSISARPDRILIRPIAAGYAAPPDGGEARHTAHWYAPAALSPGGGLAGTPADIARLMRLIRARLMAPPLPIVPTVGWRYAGWGPGLARYRLGETSYCRGHDGTTAGQVCAVRLREDHPGTVVVAANAVWAASQIGALAEDILRATWGLADPPPLPQSDPLSGYAHWQLPADTNLAGRYTRLNATMTITTAPDEIAVEELYSPQDAMNWFGVEAGGGAKPVRERLRRTAPYSYASTGKELHFLRHPDDRARLYVHDGMRASVRTNRSWT